MKKKKLYIIGAGSVGEHLAANIQDYSGKYEIEGFFDDDLKKKGANVCGYPIIGPATEILHVIDVAVVIGIAFPKIKKKIVELLSSNKSLNYPVLIHSYAWVSKNVSVGCGSVIYPGSSINYGSIIGDHVVMNMNCALGHHTKVGNFTSFAPGVNTGGYTTIEESVEIGIGVSTLQNTNIGSNSKIGGQAMVVDNIPSDSTAIGVPAKVVYK